MVDLMMMKENFACFLVGSQWRQPFIFHASISKFFYSLVLFSFIQLSCVCVLFSFPLFFSQHLTDYIYQYMYIMCVLLIIFSICLVFKCTQLLVFIMLEDFSFIIFKNNYTPNLLNRIKSFNIPNFNSSLTYFNIYSLKIILDLIFTNLNCLVKFS